MTRNLKLGRITALACAFVAVAGGAYAAQLEEIVVTATYRAENVQDVPIAVTALSGEMMAKADIHDLDGIANHTPGLSYAEFAPGQTYPALRGISSAEDGAGLDNSAALFLDGVYIGRQAAINFDMFDLERVEVLRGPQGTLFGRNAIGGAVNVVSQKPGDEFKAKFAATGGNEGILRIQGLVSGPISENLSGKVTYSHREHDGFVRNILLDKDHQNENSDSVRGQLVYYSERSEWSLIVDAMDDDREDMGRTPIVEGNFPYPTFIRETLGAGPRENAQPADGFSKRDAQGISLTGEIDFENGTLTTITAFRSADTDWEMASIGAPAGGGTAPDGNPYGVDVIDDIEEAIDTFSQEIRWTSEGTDRFNYTVGLYFFTEDTDRPERFRLDMNRADSGQFPIGIEYTRTENETTSYAVYGQANWEFSDAWKLTFGARYTIDEKDYRATAVNCGLDLTGTAFENWPGCLHNGAIVAAAPGRGSLGIIAEAFIVEPSDSWEDFSPMVSLQYSPNVSTMFFGTISNGFKSGGFAGSQGVEVAATEPVDPEQVINYEVGFKSDISDTFRLNASAFLMDYTDLQVVRFGPVPTTPFGTFLTTNIGEAEITGLETEFTWYPTDNLRIGGFYAYLDTDTDDLIINGTDYSGVELTRAPKSSFNLNAVYTVDTGFGTIEAGIDYSYTDEMHFDYTRPESIRADKRKLWDARVSWTAIDESWDVSLWGKNLTDEDWISHMYVIGPGGIGVWGPPRTFGVTVTWSSM